MKIKTMFVILLFVSFIPMIWYLKRVKTLTLIEKISSNEKSMLLLNNGLCKTFSKKWIVLTTIFYPTPSVHRFLSIDHWSLVVIGDVKTPDDWLSRLTPNLRRKVIFLSLSKQKKLNYGIIKYLPENCYSRKNIGYLVAIECGAEIIFESDDDNFLQNRSIEYLPKISSSDKIPQVAFHGERSSFVNIYGSFGQPNLWPRGFPIEQWKNVTEDGWSSLKRNENKIFALIQQYLVDLDPDLDAIYRLSNQFKIGQIRFNREQKPIALEPFTFSPYNTQNTIIHYEAFWGLFLPVKTSFRVCDIWRSFWVQRILWDIGGQIVFNGPTVRQKRHFHNYIKDLKEEEQIYDQTSSFVRFLSLWNSSSTLLFQRIQHLAEDIAHYGFWNKQEVTFLNIWIKDLQRVGYQPSQVKFISNKSPQTMKRKRAAICVTGKVACTNSTWNSMEKIFKEKISGEIDTFFFLSSSPSLKSCQCLNHIFQYNTTAQILYVERHLSSKLFEKNCQKKSNSSINEKNSFYQDLWAQNKCYQLVKSYEEFHRINYQLFVRVQFGSVFTQIPFSYERPSPLNINITVILPYDIQKKKVNHLFVIGPMKQISSYIHRWNNSKYCYDNSLQIDSTLRQSISLDNQTLLHSMIHISDLC